jgi:exodeoxyribonuclease V gamma subunit
MTVPPGFFSIHANKLENMRAAALHIAKTSPVAPLARETYLVQSNGMAQWLQLGMAAGSANSGDGAGGLGVAAGVECILPSSFAWRAYRIVLGDEIPEHSPLDKEPLAWRLFRHLPHWIEQDEAYAPLRNYLATDNAELFRWQLAQRLADLFDQYQVFRADWLRAWAEQDDRLLDARQQWVPLPPPEAWQPILWRSLVNAVGKDVLAANRAGVHERFLQALQAGQVVAPDKLPQRIIVFGVSSLPRQLLEVISALRSVTQVIFCVHNPCQYYWADLVSDSELFRAENRRGKARVIDDTGQDGACPLLATWGRQGRDFVRLLDEFDSAHRGDELPAIGVDLDLFDAYEGAGILATIQNDILFARTKHEVMAEQRTWHAADASLVFHSAHSPLREVEVLHDQLLECFQQDDQLRPLDIMVMVPDINAYAPLIQAVFSRYETSHPHYIPFVVSDQTDRDQEPIVHALEALLSLSTSRFTLSEVMALLEVPALRQRFGFSETDLDQLLEWAQGTTIRWGLHASQRAHLGLPADLDSNTWQSGLRQMLLGYAMGADLPWCDTEPYAEVAGLGADLAGRLAHLLGELEEAWDFVCAAHPFALWRETIAGWLTRFFKPIGDDEKQVMARLSQHLDACWRSVELANMGEFPIPVQPIRSVIMERLGRSHLSARFIAGRVNFASLMPMRAIPFKVVCLLGMNDGDYPRTRNQPDFDLMARFYRPGDRSRREDDRYLFLEALLSARQRLYISWVGRSIRDDSPRVCSVLVAQLRDYIDRYWRLASPEHNSGQDKKTVTTHLTTEHPLQPFSTAYFPGAPEEHPKRTEGRTLFSYASEWREVHQAEPQSDVSRRHIVPFQCPEEPLTLATLARFLREPIKTFYRHSLGVYFPQNDEQIDEKEIFVHAGLERWRVKNSVLEAITRAVASGSDVTATLAQARARLQRTGLLGMGVMQAVHWEPLQTFADHMYTQYISALGDNAQRPTASVPISHHYTDPTSGHTLVLQDQLDGVYPPAEQDVGLYVVLTGTNMVVNQPTQKPSVKSIRWDKVLPFLLNHVALNSTGVAYRTIVIAESWRAIPLTLEPIESHEAKELLDRLLALWVVGVQEPLPMVCSAGFAYAIARSTLGDDDSGEAAQAFRDAIDKALEDRTLPELARTFATADEMMEHPLFMALIEQCYTPFMALMEQ